MNVCVYSVYPLSKKVRRFDEVQPVKAVLNSRLSLIRDREAMRAARLAAANEDTVSQSSMETTNDGKLMARSQS